MRGHSLVAEWIDRNKLIYNTLGFNNCPPGKWNKLTEAEVNQEFGSQKAQLNGPRHWVLDHIQSTGSATSTGKTFTFGGIEMGLDGTLTTPAGQPTVGQQAYVVNQVQRDTIWTYDAGKRIFELTAPDGHVYVMQSYSQLVDKRASLPGSAPAGRPAEASPGLVVYLQKAHPHPASEQQWARLHSQ